MPLLGHLRLKKHLTMIVDSRGKEDINVLEALSYVETIDSTEFNDFVFQSLSLHSPSFGTHYFKHTAS